MKLKLKLVVAALALAAAGQASANIADSVSGNGEMFLSVYDANAQMSYTRDLGVTIDQFVSGAATNNTWNFASDSLLDGFKTAGALNSGITWGLGAMDSIGVQRYLTTTNAPTGTASGQIGFLNNASLKSFKTNTDVYIGAVNVMAGSTPVAVNSSIVATPADGSAYVPTGFGDKWGQASNFSMMSNVGTAQNFFLLSTVGTSPTAKIKVQQFTSGLNDYKVNLASNGNLMIAAVPEADTWAMFGVGLLMVGAIARRRMQS